MRRCGKRYTTKTEATQSKRGQGGGFYPVACRTGCTGWHLKRNPVTAGITAKPPSDTGPSRSVRALVMCRDGYACVRCGQSTIGRPHSIQHRCARQSGGTSDLKANSPANLILLCGSATTMCHGEVTANEDPHDLAAGYRLESWQDPERESVLYVSEYGSGQAAWLLPDGSLAFESPFGEAAA
jgi:5-methylcytosine-specific restriction endonuclease McrA